MKRHSTDAYWHGTVTQAQAMRLPGRVWVWVGWTVCTATGCRYRRHHVILDLSRATWLPEGWRARHTGDHPGRSAW